MKALSILVKGILKPHSPCSVPIPHANTCHKRALTAPTEVHILAKQLPQRIPPYNTQGVNIITRTIPLKSHRVPNYITTHIVMDGTVIQGWYKRLEAKCCW
jgi:hypothetical protein